MTEPTTPDARRSVAFSPYTMPAALAAADPIVGFHGEYLDELDWQGDRSPRLGDGQQREWLETFRPRARSAAQMPFIRSHATTSQDDHRAWLRAQGWDTQVPPAVDIPHRDGLMIASTMTVEASWATRGRAYQDMWGTYRAHLSNGVMASIAVPGHHPVVEVRTQDPGVVFLLHQMDKLNDKASLSFSRTFLTEFVRGMARVSVSMPVEVDFPMVGLTCQDDADYMLGLRRGDYVVAQASEQVRLTLEEVGDGAPPEEVDDSRGMHRRDVIYIGGPFIVAVVRTDMPSGHRDSILLAAYCDRDAWRQLPSRLPGP